MGTVLVSFIGTGELENLEYKDTDYHFGGETSPRKTAVFGSALLDYLKSRNEQVVRWLIMGTEQSIWSELINISSDLSLTPDEEKLKDFLWEQSYYCATSEGHISQISQEKLNAWQIILSKKRANTEVSCQLVGDATDSDSHNLIFQSLLKAIQKDHKVVFDVTHGLRNQPIITSFVLMYLRYLRNIKAENIEFYYGAKDLDGKVIKLGFCNELLLATEAVAIFEQTGHFQRIGEQIGLSPAFQQNLEALAFSDEMFRLKLNAAQKVIIELKNQGASLQTNPLKSSLAGKLDQSLKWADENSYANRLKEKATREFKHKQYFKAVASLWEAVLIAECEVSNTKDVLGHTERNNADKRLQARLEKNAKNNNVWKEPKNNYWHLKNLRNAVLHGADTSDEKVKQALNSLKDFKDIFDKGLDLFEEIKSKKI